MREILLPIYERFRKDFTVRDLHAAHPRLDAPLDCGQGRRTRTRSPTDSRMRRWDSNKVVLDSSRMLDRGVHRLRDRAWNI